MPRKKKFIAENYNYELIRKDEVNDQTFNADITFNLSELNLNNLLKGLVKSVNKGTKLFHFTQKRENERVTLKIQHIQLLQTALQETRKLGKEIMEVKADKFLSPEIIESLIEGKRIDLKNERYSLLFLLKYYLLSNH